MSKQTGTKKEPKESVNVKREKIIQIGTIVAALITLIGVGINAYVNYQSNMIPIYAAQTAEAKFTEIALSFTSTFTNTPSPTFTTTPTFTETLTPSPTFTSTPEPISRCNTFEPSVIPSPPPNSPKLFIVFVSAKLYWCNTYIEVFRGQRLVFEAKGEWYSGLGSSGPNGDAEKPLNGGEIMVEKFGTLIGSIGMLTTDRETLNIVAFKVGSGSTYTVLTDGILFLSMNENIRGCEKVPPDDCFSDNGGSLEVSITVQ